ncbi:MAG: GDSL-type esterase/lipase family protein [Patescibacteria group bacterium]
MVKYLLFFILLASLWLGFAVLRAFFLIQVGTSIQKNAVPYERKLENAEKNILVIGDSTGVGTGADQPTESVAGRIGADFPRASVVNISRNGKKTREVISELTSLRETFDVIVIQIGGNDVLYFTARQALEKDIEAVLTEAKKRSAHVVLVTAGDVGEAPFFSYPFGYFWSKQTLAVREIFLAAAKRHGVEYVDLYAEKVGQVFRTDTARYYSKDMLHPSGDGYALWYEKVAPFIR